MDAAVNAVNRNFTADIGIFIAVLLMASGALVYGAYRSMIGNKQKERSKALGVLALIGAAVFLFLAIKSFNKRYGFKNWVGMGVNRAKAVQNRFAAMRAPAPGPGPVAPVPAPTM
jgi:uncharacterized membrane protein YeaQ/YmgE (transglycosylase-associated protein family)